MLRSPPGPTALADQRNVAEAPRSLPATRSLEDPRYRPDIDGLRAIAVGLVALGHTGLLFPGGFIGVDVFFVISGFLITRLILSGYQDGTLTLKQFWLRRIRRILPAAAVLVAITLLAGILLLRPTELRALAESAIAQQLCLSNIYFWAQGGYFDLPSEHKPLLHTWSLAVEEQFYLVWPLILVLVYRRGKKAVAWLIGALGAASLLASEILTRTHTPLAFYFMPTRMWELLLGAGILFSLPPKRLRPLISFAGLALILLSATTYTPRTPFPGLSALLPCVGTAIIIATPRTPVSAFLSTRPMLYVGKASYSIYLWHWPLLVFTRMYLGRSFSFAAQLAVVLASVALGSLSYEFVETPIRSRRWLPDNKRLVFCCLLAALLICTTAFTTTSFLEPDYPQVTSASSNMALDDEIPSEADSRALGLKEIPHGARCLALGVPGSPMFVLWGDSHALAIVNLCHQLARSHGISGRCFAVPDTPPLLGVWNKSAETSTSKLVWNRGVVGWIKDHKIPNVLMVSRWEARVPSSIVDWHAAFDGLDDQARAKAEDDMESRMIEDSRSPGVSAEDARRVWRLAFPRTMSELTGTHVWFLMQPPVQEDDPLERSSRGVTQSAYLAQQYEITEVVNSYRSPNLTIIGPGTHWFDRGYSLVADRSGSYYRDKNHVSSYGAKKLLGPLLELVFEQMKSETRNPKSERIPKPKSET